MDWQGQKLAEHLMQLLLICFAVMGFTAGYVLESFQMMMSVYAAGVVLTSLVTVPNWSFFNHHPLNFLDPSETKKHPKPHPASSPKKKISKNERNDGSGADFVAGFVVGGALFGTLAYIFAPQAVKGRNLCSSCYFFSLGRRSLSLMKVKNTN